MKDGDHNFSAGGIPSCTKVSFHFMEL